MPQWQCYGATRLAPSTHGFLFPLAGGCEEFGARQRELSGLCSNWLLDRVGARLEAPTGLHSCLPVLYHLVHSVWGSLTPLPLRPPPPPGPLGPVLEKLSDLRRTQLYVFRCNARALHLALQVTHTASLKLKESLLMREDAIAGLEEAGAELLGDNGNGVALMSSEAFPAPDYVEEEHVVVKKKKRGRPSKKDGSDEDWR